MSQLCRTRVENGQERWTSVTKDSEEKRELEKKKRRKKNFFRFHTVLANRNSFYQNSRNLVIKFFFHKHPIQIFFRQKKYTKEIL